MENIVGTNPKEKIMNIPKCCGSTERKGLILSLAFATFYFNATVRFFVPVIMPLIIVSLHVSIVHGALLVTTYWVGYTIMQIPSGVIVDRFTASRVNITSFFLMAGIFTLFYFFITSFTGMLVIQFSLGMISALVFISDISLIQTLFTQKKRSISVGIYQTAFFLAYSLGGFMIIRLASISITIPILAISVMLFVLGVINLFFVRDPEHMATPRRKRSIRVPLSSGLIYVGLIRFAGGFVYLGFLTLFTTYLVASGNVTYGSSGKYSLMAAIAGVLGSPLGGIITSRYAKTKLYPALFSAALLAFTSIAAAFATSLLTIVVVALIMGFSYGLYASPSMSLATELTKSDEEIGAASGFLSFSTQIGGVVSPFIIAYLTVVTGSYGTGFIVIGILALIFLSPIAFLIIGKRQDTINVRALRE